MLRLVMGAFVSSSDDEEDEGDQQTQQERGPHGDSEHEELVDTTESELRTITLKPVDRQNLSGKMLKYIAFEVIRINKIHTCI